MKILTIFALLNGFIGCGQVTAQTQSEVPVKTRLLYGSISLNLGWAKMSEYRAFDAFTSNLYLEPGNSANLSFSLRGRNLGFSLYYFNDRFPIDIAKTISEGQPITGLEVRSPGPNRLQNEGFLIGPYLGGSADWLKSLSFAVMPAIGVVSTTLPGLTFDYSTGGFSVNSPKVTNRLTYSIGVQVSYAFWRQFAIGATLRYSSFKTPDLDKLQSKSYTLSLLYHGFLL